MAPKSVKSKRKKKKKRVVSAKGQLEKEADSFILQDTLHKMFIDRIGEWMLNNIARVIDIFLKFDQNGDGVLSYEEFFAGMRDLDAPFSNLELLVLAKTVDKNCDRHINYTEFSEGIKYQRTVPIWKDDVLPVLKFDREMFEECPSCNISRWKNRKQDTIRFINLKVKYISMTILRTAPCHFQKNVHSHIAIEGVVEMVRLLYDHAISRVTMYHIKNKENTKIELKPWLSLQECGFAGGSEDSPEYVELFYEINDDSISCPILQCDHYFHRKKKSK